MRILMISTYPPTRDGIATYTVQVVAALQAEGHEVEVLSPQPSAAHHHLDFHAGGRFGLALARRVAAYDKVIVQWHPAFFYRSVELQHRVAVDLAIAAAFRRARSVEVWVHEYEYAEVAGRRVRSAAARALFGSADALFFHSETERQAFLDVVAVGRGRTHVADHGARFIRHSQVSRQSARRSLGLPETGHVFLCIGFIQHHKGFDRAIRAFAGLHATGARLDVVGSTRLDEPDFVAHLTELERLAAATPGAHLHEGFVSDEAFDRWIIASDTVVLPYRHIWSSGVMERAALYHRAVIATDVGGLAQQADHRAVTLVQDDAGLARAMRDAVGAPEQPAAEPPAQLDPENVYESVRDVVRARALRARGRELATATGALPDPSGATTPPVRAAQSSLPVRRLPALGKPPATSTRPGVPQLKRTVRRMTDWQIDPVVRQLAMLQSAVVAGLDSLEARVAALESSDGQAAAPAPGDRSADAGTTAPADRP